MLQIKNVNLNVGNTALLSNINLTLEQGKNYGVLGPNGAGKTTLFKSMLGLTDFSGEILSDGQPVSSRCFGSLIEYPAFYSRLTVEENLNLHAQYLGLKQPNIEAALKQVNLLDARKKLFSQLSLGMRQRLGIARAFLGDVQYLLLDERFTELSADYEAEQKELKERAARLREELSKAQEATANAEKFMNVVRRHTTIEELTPTLLREFVEKIVVHESVALDGKRRGKLRRQEIEIYYSFVGKVELPDT